MMRTSQTYNLYLSQFENFEKKLNGGSKSFIGLKRREGIEQFAKLGFPTIKDEEWRFTNLSPLINTEFSSSIDEKSHSISKERLDKLIINGIGTNCLIFINGKYDRSLSRIDVNSRNVSIISLSEALTSSPKIVEQYLNKYSSFSSNSFTALNTGFMLDGAFIHLPDETILRDPIYLVFIASAVRNPIAYHPRNLIIIGKNSQVSIVEHYLNDNGNTYFTNSVTELVLKENSKAIHTKIQDESLKAFHVGALNIIQKANSNFTSNSIMIGGSIARNNITNVFEDENIESTLNGLTIGVNEQLIDNHTVIDHTKPNCTSHELYKNILGDRSKGVFNGKIFVRKNAQKTNAKQTNKTLLLTESAKMNTKPQLEIFADDVRCTHGATVGYLDDESIFYLRSRGIGEESAREILTFAFANEVIDRISHENIQNHVKNIIDSRLRFKSLSES